MRPARFHQSLLFANHQKLRSWPISHGERTFSFPHRNRWSSWRWFWAGPYSWCRWGVPWKALAHHGQATVVLQKHFKVFLVDLHIREWVGGVSAAKDIFQIAFDSASKTSLWAYVLLIECYWFLIEFIMAKKRVAYFRSSHLDLGSDHLRKTDAQDTADADKVFR
jgi:hypothetical protein